VATCASGFPRLNGAVKMKQTGDLVFGFGPEKSGINQGMIISQAATNTTSIVIPFDGALTY